MTIRANESRTSCVVLVIRLWEHVCKSRRVELMRPVSVRSLLVRMYGRGQFTLFMALYRSENIV